MSFDITGVAMSAVNPLQGLQQMGQVIGLFEQLINKAKSGNVSPNDLTNLMQSISGSGAPGGNTASQPVPFSSSGTVPQSELSGSGNLSSQVQSQWTDRLNQIANIGNAVNNLEQQAQQLMSSPNPADQAKGQMLMQQATQMFNALSQMMKQMSDMAEKAIQNSSSQ